MKWYLKVLNQYADFDGRARRKEYWIFFLFNTIFAFVAIFLDTILEITIEDVGYGPLYIVYSLVMFIPSTAVNVRRLHDVGKSGWMYFIVLIPLIGLIWLLVLLCSNSDKGKNQYGENPKDLNKPTTNKSEKVKIEKPSNLITETKTAMEGFNQCNQGHFFKELLNECPYCPKGDVSSSEKTEVIGKTKQSNSNDDVQAQKTQVFGAGAPSGTGHDSNDALRTVISGASSDIDSEDVPTNSKRRLRGWLVSFDIEDFGVDFRIKEGKNSIGKNSTNDITINDDMVSNTHALLLCRNDKFVIRDEMSSNGTFINGEEISPSQPVDLKDGDELKFGKTSYLFRQAFK